MSVALTRFRESLFSPLDWFPMLFPAIRVEEYTEGDRYIVRAEVPGVNPDKEIQVFVEDDLRIHVERTEQKLDKRHSEFHYGSFFRRIPLPVGVVKDTLRAKYADGVLEISMKVSEPALTGKEIPVEVATTK